MFEIRDTIKFAKNFSSDSDLHDCALQHVTEIHSNATAKRSHFGVYSSAITQPQCSLAQQSSLTKSTEKQQKTSIKHHWFILQALPVASTKQY
jgi:hypothetical protein